MSQGVAVYVTYACDVLLICWFGTQLTQRVRENVLLLLLVVRVVVLLVILLLVVVVMMLVLVLFVVVVLSLLLLLISVITMVMLHFKLSVRPPLGSNLAASQPKGGDI